MAAATSIFVRRPSCLELTARTLATNHFNRPFQALSKNVFIRAYIALSALETFCSMSLLTYLLVARATSAWAGLRSLCVSVTAHKPNYLLYE